MIRPQRRRHLIAWLVLAPMALALLVLGARARPSGEPASGRPAAGSRP